MMNQLLHMYNSNSWIQTPGAPTAPEMWSEPRPWSKPESGPEAHTWEVPNAWCRCVTLTVQPASPDVTPDSGLFMGAGREGDTSTTQHSPCLEPPRALGSRGRIQTQGRFTCGWTPVLSRNIKCTGRGDVVISSIKYSTHPDIRSLLSLLIGWLTLGPIWITRSLTITMGHRLRPARVQTLMQICHTVTLLSVGN